MKTRFIRKFSALALAATVASLAASALADYTTGTVSGLTAGQQFLPWNGNVEISLNLAGPEEKYYLNISATDAATGVDIPVRTLRDKAGNTVGRSTEFAPGAISLVWDATADAPGLLVESLILSVVTARPCVQLWKGGPYWATTNIGAEEPWEYGLYFWWGDTIGYRREGDAWVASDGSSQNFEFYYDEVSKQTYNKSPTTLQSEGWITADGVLAPAHDAARVHWGDSWRMPTKQELDDLCSNCDGTWTTMNGVNGYVIRGRGDYADASIFLPAAGYVNRTSLINNGSYGHYWSSAPEEIDNRYTRALSFYSGYRVYTCSGSRYDGQIVRPVLGF